MNGAAPLALKVNGATHVVCASADTPLLYLLRNDLALNGPKFGCGLGECGACTVLLDGAPAYSCLTLTAACDGREVATIEGLAHDGTLHSVQRAFIDHDALQCGFCTPGQILAAVALLERQPHPTEDDVRRGMSGNLCRCGAYAGIVAAVRRAAAQA